MEIKIYNDTKEKSQSFEAWSDNLTIKRGYGPTKEEAIKEYKNLLIAEAWELRQVLGALYSQKYTTANVSIDGKPLLQNGKI